MPAVLVVAPLRPLAVAVLTLSGLLAVFKWGRMLATPAEWISAEGWHVFEVRALLDGFRLYADPASMPHIVMNYTPLFVLAQLPLAALFGAQVWIGRAVVVTSVLLSGLVVYAAAHARGASRPAASVAAGLFLFHPITLSWGALARVDYPALLFGVLPLLLLDRPRFGATQAVVIGLLVVLGGMIKQNSVLLLLPVCLIAVGRRDPLQLPWLVASLTVSGLLALLVCLWLSASPSWFWWHTVSGNVVSYSMADLLVKWRLFIVVSAGLLVLATLGARRRLDHWVGFTVLALCSALSVMIVNGGMNYFIPAIAGLAVVGSEALSRAAGRLAGGLQLSMGLAAALGLVVADASYVSQIATTHDALTVLASSVHGPAVLDYALVADPRQDQYVFVYEYAQRVHGGKLPSTFLLDRLARSELTAVVLETPDALGPAATMGLQSNYAEADPAGRLRVYRPRG